MSKRRAKTIIQDDRVHRLEREIIALKRTIQSKQAQLKAVDLAVFECFQKSHIGPLGKVTDNVMDRCREYSDSIGEQVIVKLTSTTPKRKRKARA